MDKNKRRIFTLSTPRMVPCCFCERRKMARINVECLKYAREHFKDLEQTAYRVPDVLFPREGQTGDVLTREEIRSGLHSKYADKRHKNVSIAKLLEERHALLPVEIIAQKLYNWGTIHKEAMFVLCNYNHANYFEKVPSKRSRSDGEYDIVAMGSFGFAFIQVKAFALTSSDSETVGRSAGHNEKIDGKRELSEQTLGLWGPEHIRKAVEQLINDRKEFLETNKDLSFVKFAPMHFVVGVPDVESVHDTSVRAVIEAKLDSYKGSTKEEANRMRVFTIYKDTVASQKSFDDWFRRYILLKCETKRLFFTDDLYTIVGRYTCPEYSKVSRWSTPGLGTKRSSTLISRFVLTEDQQKLLRNNARRQIIAGGFGTGKTLLLLEEAMNLVIGDKTDVKERSKPHHEGKDNKHENIKGSRSRNETNGLQEANVNDFCTKEENTFAFECQSQCEVTSREASPKDHTKPSFCFILSCSNVGENGFVFNDPDLLVEQLANHLRTRARLRGRVALDKIDIFKLDEVIKRSFPDEKVSKPNIACEMLTVDVLMKTIHDLAGSKPGYTCHIMLDEFPSIDLVSEFDWSKIQNLHNSYPDMRLWIALSAEGNMQTYLSCDDTLEVKKKIGVPKKFEFGFLQESKRMTQNVYRLMEKTQEYEGKTKREHFRCGIEIEDHIPMWIPMLPCFCGNIEKGFFKCTCMCGRLTDTLKEVFKRISHFGNENVFILLHVVMFESLRENLVDLLTRALREIKVGCRVEIPKLERYSFTVGRDEFNEDFHLHDSSQVTLIHNRYFHGCEGKVMIVFPPLGGPQFQPQMERSSLAIPFDNVIARAVSRLFIITPTEVGMIQYSKELCMYIVKEKERETNSDKNAKWDKFLSIFRHREVLPSYLSKMVKEGVLVKCPVGVKMADEEPLPVVDTMHTLNITDAPITKWYMT